LSFLKYNEKVNKIYLKNLDLSEEDNIIRQEIFRQGAIGFSLDEKKERYMELNAMVEGINRDLSLEAMTDKISETAFRLIGRRKGNCILYLADDRTQKISIVKTKKEDPGLVIKAKEGDIFDTWVSRHASPLLVEDIKKDFRFDLGKIDAQPAIGSLISAPFISAHRFLGILRLEHPQPGFYSLDDLRFLSTICDTGAVALENSQLFQRTQELAIHDELTGLYTKGYFMERLKEELKRSQRQGRVFSLLMLDIDLFKKYNDKFGHTAGDMVLRALSANTSGFLGQTSPVVCRFGGEEFCAILPGIDKEGACRVAEDLRRKIEEIKINLRRQESAVTVSIGVSGFPEDAQDAEVLIIKADRAMYEAKQEGRNKVFCAK